MSIPAILLCAGKGTRMNDDSKNKVCFPVNGKPAILRTMDNMTSGGISSFICVVGHKSDTVMTTVSDYYPAVYAYQSVQLGTGNAALIGLTSLTALGYKGPVLIAMGDKIISEDIISSLLSIYNSSNSSVVFAVTPKDFNPSGGRILSKNGKLCGIYEMTDSYALLLSGAKSESECFDRLSNYSISEKKKSAIVEYALRKEINCEFAVMNKTEFTHDEIEASVYVNAAAYLCDSEKMISALSRLDSNNAQGEIYLTDAINILISNSDAKTVIVDSRDKIHTFSNKEELEKVSRYFADLERNF